MARVKTRPALRRTSIEFSAFRGKNHPDNYYLLVKARRRGGDFFEVFAAAQLKEVCIDILGLEDSPETRRKTNANDLARKVWKRK